jgi:hypothetical protein
LSCLEDAHAKGCLGPSPLSTGLGNPLGNNSLQSSWEGKIVSTATEGMLEMSSKGSIFHSLFFGERKIYIRLYMEVFATQIPFLDARNSLNII